MKRLSNADLRDLYLKKRFLERFISEKIPEFMSPYGLAASDSLVRQINDVRKRTEEIVGDPHFDSLVSVARKHNVLYHTIDSVSNTAKELLSYINDVLLAYSSPKARELQQTQGQGGNVFITHGHNQIVRYKVKDFLRDRCGLNPIVLQELPSAGMTIIEKLEKHGRTADYAVVILTGDDITEHGEARARQNVIQELGWFQGVLGRNRTAMLVQRGVELFSNISGIVYLEFEGDAVEGILEDLRKELEEAGLI